MPYSNFHAARVQEPLPQSNAIYATKAIAPGITIILQKHKDSSSSMEVQAYRFEKRQYTAQESREWLKKHNIKIISFEPATTPGQEARNEVFKKIKLALEEVVA